MKLIPILIIIAVFKPQVDAIECKYVEVVPGKYGCEVLQDLWNQTTDIVTGQHQDGKTDDDVRALFINAKSDWEFSPIYCRTFINLQRIHIERVETVKRDDFKYCKKAQHLLIVGTDLWYLPEDVFSAMEDLRILEINMNKIVYLPRDLISNNRRLEKVLFQDNKIQVVDLVFPTSLKSISMDANQCIDRSVPSREVKTIDDFNKILLDKCGSSTAKRVRDLEYQIRTKRYETEPEKDVVNVAGSAFNFAAQIPGAALSQIEAESYKNWFIFLSCMCAFLVVGWAGTAFVLMKRMNDITHGDQHYLVSMDANTRREFCED